MAAAQNYLRESLILVSMISPTGGNDLLEALSQRERDRVLNLCESVTLTQDETLCEAGEHFRYVYFPVDSFIALVTQVDQHDALAVGLIGSEGMLGVTLLLGVPHAPLRARVQGDGAALRMSVENFQRVLSETPALRRPLDSYLYLQVMQLAQNAACASYHVMEQRLAYWLLMAHDRAHADRFYLTHDRLAHMLGMRRSGVSTAAGMLQENKLIRYTRGHIVVLDRKGLERSACCCYQMLRDAPGLIAPAVEAIEVLPVAPERSRPSRRAPAIPVHAQQIRHASQSGATTH